MGKLGGPPFWTTYAFTMDILAKDTQKKLLFNFPIGIEKFDATKEVEDLELHIFKLFCVKPNIGSILKIFVAKKKK
jgi:hypothetical protein